MFSRALHAYHALDDGGSSVDRPLPRPPRPKSDRDRFREASELLARWAEPGRQKESMIFKYGDSIVVGREIVIFSRLMT